LFFGPAAFKTRLKAFTQELRQGNSKQRQCKKHPMRIKNQVLKDFTPEIAVSAFAGMEF